MTHPLATHPHGHQPTGRHVGSGSLRWHAFGCAVNGGKGLPPGVCHKCAETLENKFTRALMRADARKKKQSTKE